MTDVNTAVDPERLKTCAAHFVHADTDVIIYSGSIDRAGYEEFCDRIPKNKKKNLLLVLCTFGGDPNAGYRIARAALHNYEAGNFKILIPSYCKSAGTLICIGAHELIMADSSELGPLDIQLRKQDEIFQVSSGLDILRGLTYLQQEALQSFRAYLLDINAGSGLSTTIASEISSKLVIGLYEPLFAQIDPVRLGEMSAAVQIAHEYGRRLNEKSKSLKAGSLGTLVSNYPTHGFVIDRAEARSLFERVTRPDSMAQFLAQFVNGRVWPQSQQGKATVLDFTALFAPTQPNEGNHDAGNTTEDTAINDDNEQPEQRMPPGDHEGSANSDGQQQSSVVRKQNDAGPNQGNPQRKVTRIKTPS